MNAAARRAAAESTLTLPFTIPPQEWFTPAAAAKVIGLSERMVEKLVQQGGQLDAHVHNGGEGLRNTIRIPRTWIVTYLVRTARYDDASLDDAFMAALRHRPVESLLKISREALRLAAAGGASRQ